MSYWTEETNINSLFSFHSVKEENLLSNERLGLKWIMSSCHLFYFQIYRVILQRVHILYPLVPEIYGNTILHRLFFWFSLNRKMNLFFSFQNGLVRYFNMLFSKVVWSWIIQFYDFSEFFFHFKLLGICAFHEKIWRLPLNIKIAACS